VSERKETDLDPGILGRATSDAEDVDTKHSLIAGMADIFTNGTPADVFEFAQGTLDVTRAMACGLIRNGLVEPNFLQPEIAQRAAMWEAKGRRHRALALRSMLDSLKTIETAVVENQGKGPKPN
jgi:hypothetical protein